MKLTTNRLIIRNFKYDDDNDLFMMCKDKDTAYNAGWSPHQNIDVSRNVIVGYMYRNETFAILLKDTKKLIGTISLYENTLRKHIKCRELGFCLNKYYRQNGYMMEAVERVLEYGFKTLDLDLIMVCHHKENIACQKLIQKFPFMYEGTLRMYRTLYDGSIIDGVMYSMKKEEYWRNKR